MHRFLPTLALCAALLYGCSTTPIFAPRPELPAPESPSARPQVVQPPTVVVPAAPEVPEAETSPLPADRLPPAGAALPGSGAPQKGDIALILPLQSTAFAAAARAVHDGFIAAHSLAGNRVNLPVVIYATGDQVADILAAYQQAVQAGSRIVVGPLTRNAVTALAASNEVVVPTLALNIPERDVSIPDNLYLFGLQVEAEARQIARLAAGQGKRSALTVSTDTQLSRRIRQAFVNEWTKLGGKEVEQLSYSTDPQALARLRGAATSGRADMVFLAVEFEKARVVRPYLDIEIPIYATSQVFNGGADSLANFDLNGVRFVDMPWLLQANHPAVMIYPRPQNASSADLERLYALGLDAFRIAQYLLQPDTGTPSIDGVTGRVTLEANHQFVRELTPAQFEQGSANVIAADRKQ